MKLKPCYDVIKPREDLREGNSGVTALTTTSTASSTGQSTSGGERLFLRRYTFDAQHNLLNHTSREYCGSIPASGYR